VLSQKLQKRLSSCASLPLVTPSASCNVSGWSTFYRDGLVNARFGRTGASPFRLGNAVVRSRVHAKRRVGGTRGGKSVRWEQLGASLEEATSQGSASLCVQFDGQWHGQAQRSATDRMGALVLFIGQCCSVGLLVRSVVEILGIECARRHSDKAKHRDGNQAGDDDLHGGFLHPRAATSLLPYELSGWSLLIGMPMLPANSAPGRFPVPQAVLKSSFEAAEARI